MIQTKMLEKAKNAVVLNKRTAAFFIFGAKIGRTDSHLSNSIDSEINLNTAAALKKCRKAFFTEGAAPNNGVAPFTYSTKNKHFRRKKGNSFCSDPILPEILCLRHKAPEQRLVPMC